MQKITKTVVLISLILFLAACADPIPEFIRTSAEKIGASIHVNTNLAMDELNCQPGWPTSPTDPATPLMQGCAGAPNGACSLLEALAAAQANRAVDSCAAGLPDAQGQDAIYL